MSKYAKNMRPNRSAPSSFNSSLNSWNIPFAGTMTLLDSIASSYPRPMPCNRSSSFVKCFGVFPTVTLLSDSRLKLVDIGHFSSDFRRSKASQCEISNGFLSSIECDLKYSSTDHHMARSLHTRGNAQLSFPLTYVDRGLLKRTVTYGRQGTKEIIHIAQQVITFRS